MQNIKKTAIPIHNSIYMYLFLLAGWATLQFGGLFVNSFSLPKGRIPDYYQEYASAKNFLTGVPLYTKLGQTFERDYGWELTAASVNPYDPQVSINAHPPSSILLAVPFAYLNLSISYVAWNGFTFLLFIISLYIISRQLVIPINIKTVAILYVGILAFFPLRNHLQHGQLTLLVMFFVTSAWAADRSERPIAAGIFLACATVIKLFPGFLVVYYVMRRRWGIALAWLVATCGITLLTISLFGSEVYRTYIKEAVPNAQLYKASWFNLSLTGYLSRLLNPDPAHSAFPRPTQPIAIAPLVETTLYICIALGLVCGLAVLTSSCGNKKLNDITFGIAVCCMILLSPLAWEHYLLIVILPVLIAFRVDSKWTVNRIILMFALVMMGTSPGRIFFQLGLWKSGAQPIHSLTVISYNFYALLMVLFVLKRYAKESICQYRSNNV